MKKLYALLLCSLILSGCAITPIESGKPTQPVDIPETNTEQMETVPSATEVVNETESDSTSVTEAMSVIRYIVYSPNSNADGFHQNVMEWQIPYVADYQPTILDAWIELDVLTDDIQILSMVQEENHITIDFNHAFKDLVCTMGTSGERMIIGSVVNTLIANYDVDTVSITVEGDIWESGHVIYDFPMGFFE